MKKKESFSIQAKDVNGTPNAILGMRQLLVNKEIIILNQTGGHNYGPNGTIIKCPADASLLGFAGGAGNKFTSLKLNIINATGVYYNNINFDSFVVRISLTKEDLLNDIKSLKKAKKDYISKIDEQIEECNFKIQYLKDTDSKEWNANEYKAYRTLELVDNADLSRIEKAKLIAQLIND